MQSSGSKIGIFLNRIMGIAIFLLLWEIAPTRGWIDQQFVPPLSVVLKAMGELWIAGGLFTHIMVSLWRVLNGFIVGAFIALPLGFMLGRWFPAARESLNPLFRLLGQVNPFSLSPVFLLFFGIGETAKILVIAWVCIWPVLFHTINGVKNIERVLIKSAAAMNVSNSEMFRKILLPAATPSIFSGMRVGVEMSFFMLIAAEMIGAGAGLGWLMHNAAANYHIPRIYASSVCIVVLGVMLNRFLYFLQNRVFFWKEVYDVFHLNVGIKKPKQLGRLQTVVLTLAIIAVLMVGTQQVIKANDELNSMENHNHLDMHRGGGNF